MMSHGNGISFEDTVQNWQLWGELVELWADSLHPIPSTSADLLKQMWAHGITNAAVYGPPDAKVTLLIRAAEEVVITVPTEEERKDARRAMKAGEPYDLPVFYNQAFDGPRKPMNADEINLFNMSRLGEFAINGSK